MNTKRILVACEYSGTVRDAFAARGWDAWSCDVLPTEKPGQHYQGDVLNILREGWDMMVAHPPCTYLTNAGVRHLHDHVTSRNGNRAKVFGEARWVEMRKGAAFFNALRNAPIEHIAIENPVPHKYARELIGGYDQCVQPWMFGDGEVKAVCLWLKNLPKLERTHRKDDLFCAAEPTGRWARAHRMPPGPNRAKERSRFFPGIAKAMANQWTLATRPNSVHVGKQWT